MTKVTNRALSIENIISLLIIVFSIGVVYSSLAAESAETKERVRKMEAEQKQLGTSMKNIQVDVAVIKNDQKHVRAELDNQRSDLKRVLRILEKK